MQVLARITDGQDRMEKMITEIDQRQKKETVSAEREERLVKALERIADGLEAWQREERIVKALERIANGLEASQNSTGQENPTGQEDPTGR